MIFITGCARSGTSMVAGIIARSGAWGGNVCDATRFNPKGQYENTKIRNTVIKPMLKLMKCDPMGQDPLPTMEQLLKMVNGFPAEIRDHVRKIMRNQGLRDDGEWYFKGAKVCLIWPIWMKAFPEAQYIIVERPDDLIIQSCMHTSFMRKRQTPDEWQKWINIHKERFDEMEKHLPENVHRIDSLEIVKGNFDNMKKLVEKIGLHWDQAAVEEFVDIDIWNTVK